MTTIDRKARIRAERAEIEDLKERVRALYRTAPPKAPAAVVGDPPEAALVQAAAKALDDALDAENVGSGTADDTAVAEKALLAARAKLAKAIATRELAIEMHERRRAAHDRQVRPLLDGIGARGRVIDQLMVEIYEELREQEAAALFEAERQLGVQLARCAHVVRALGDVRRRQAPTERVPVPLVHGATVDGLPAMPETAAFTGATRGVVRIVIDPNKKDQAWAGDLEIDGKAIARQMERELDAQLRHALQVQQPAPMCAIA